MTQRVKNIVQGMRKLKKGVSKITKDFTGNKALDYIMKGQMRDMNKTGRGAQARKATFVDKKTRRIVIDTPRTRKIYGPSRVKKIK